MKPNRILRKLFPKPAEAPNWWSQGTEKFIFIDESKSLPYSLVQRQNFCYILQDTIIHSYKKNLRCINKKLLNKEIKAKCQIPFVNVTVHKVLHLQNNGFFSFLYFQPNPECSNVVIRCTAGARLIRMTPSSECMQHCRSSTILLSAGHTREYEQSSQPQNQFLLIFVCSSLILRFVFFFSLRF